MSTKIRTRYYTKILKNGLLLNPSDINMFLEHFSDYSYETKEEIEEIIIKHKIYDEIVILETKSYEHMNMEE